VSCEVTIFPGRNVWLLARTDRDAPSYEDVIQTCAAYLSRVFGERSPEEIISTAPGRYIIGAARPVLIDAEQTAIDAAATFRPQIEGAVHGRYENCPEVYVVRADRTWWVMVGFDWRGPTTQREWPARSVNWLGIPSTGPGVDLDWLLVTAATSGAAKEPDTSWSQETGENVAETAKAVTRSVGIPVGLLLVGAGVVYLALATRKE